MKKIIIVIQIIIAKTIGWYRGNRQDNSSGSWF